MNIKKSRLLIQDECGGKFLEFNDRWKNTFAENWKKIRKKKKTISDRLLNSY